MGKGSVMKNEGIKSESVIKLLVAVVALALASVACTTKKKELTSKVDPDAYVRKADLTQNGAQYHLSRAILEADSNNTVEAIPGFQVDYGIVKVEVTEKELVFRRV